MIHNGFDNVAIYNADFDVRRKLSVCNRGYYEESARFEAYQRDVTNTQHPIYKEVVSAIVEFKPDLIGISLRTAKFFIAKTIIELLNESLGNVPIVVGGPHATSKPQHVLQHSKADFVIRGEGERSFLELVRTLNGDGELSRVKGLSYLSHGQVTHNLDQPLIEDLDSIPFPEKDAILHHDVMAPNDFGNIFSSRGCPFGCSFCDSRTTWSRRARLRSPANIVDEIVMTKKRFGTSFFSFTDDSFVTKKQHTLDLCDNIIRSGLASLPRTDFRWWCEIHPRLVSSDIVQRMKQAGCVAIAIGAESGSMRTLESIGKSSSPDMIRRAVKTIRDAGLSLSVFFMIGFPWETEEDVSETVRFMEELAPDNPTMSVLTPLPGTPVYDYCVEQKLVEYDDNYLNLFHQRSSGFYSHLISGERSKAIIQDALTRCDELGKRKKRDRIVAFVRDHIVPDTCSKRGVRLCLVGDSNERGEGMPAVVLSVDQSYVEETIFLRLEETDEGNHAGTSLAGELGRRLLDEFPEYARVVAETRRRNRTETEIVYPTGAGRF